MSNKKVTVTGTGASGSLSKQVQENYATISVFPTAGATPYTGLSFTVEASMDGTNYEKVAVIDNKTGLLVAGGTTISPTDGSAQSWSFPLAQNYTNVRVNVSAISGGSADFLFIGTQLQGAPIYSSIAGAAGGFTNITASGTLAVTGAATLSSTLAVSGASTLTGNVTVGASKVVMTAASGNIASAGSILSSSASGGVGYATGAGGTVTQGTSRTTGVTLNTPTGNIVLVSAAGSATPFSFTLTNSSIAAGDTVILSQKSGTDKYTTQVVTAVAAGSCQITLANASGTTTEQPVFNFCVLKGVAA